MDNQQPNFRVYISSDGLRYYIGCQTGNDPEYLGSYSDKTFKPVYKTIIGHYTSREEAGAAEIALIRELNAIKDPMFVNRAIVPVRSIEELKDTAQKLYEEHPEVKDKISESVTKLWQNPDYVLMQKESRRDHPEKMKKIWQDPEFKSSQGKKISDALNSSEIRQSAEYKAKHKEIARMGGQACKRFLDNLKKDPVAYKAYIEARNQKVKETWARKKAQRPE